MAVLSLRWRVMPPPITLRWRGPNLSPEGLPQVQQASSVQTLIGPPGAGGGSGAAPGFTYTQYPAAKTWTIPHTFPRTPQVSVFDSSGKQVFPDISVLNSTTIRIDFSGASDGTAILT